MVPGSEPLASHVSGLEEERDGPFHAVGFGRALASTEVDPGFCVFFNPLKERGVEHLTVALNSL